MEWRRRAEQGGAGVGAGAVRERRWRGARRDGEEELERRACGSGGAAQEWRRRSGVRARVQGGGFARGKKNSETDAWGPRRG